MKSVIEIYNALDMLEEPTKVPGMSYEDGIRDAFEWILGNQTDEEFIDGYKEA